jgi:hypothetical protein
MASGEAKEWSFARSTITCALMVLCFGPLGVFVGWLQDDPNIKNINAIHFAFWTLIIALVFSPIAALLTMGLRRFRQFLRPYLYKQSRTSK